MNSILLGLLLFAAFFFEYFGLINTVPPETLRKK